MSIFTRDEVNGPVTIYKFMAAVSVLTSASKSGPGAALLHYLNIPSPGTPSPTTERRYTPPRPLPQQAC